MNGILVGYDGSGHSLRALEWAAQEAAIRREPLTVLSICPAAAGRWPQDPDEGPAGLGLEEIQARAEEQADTVLTRAGTGFSRPRVAVRAVGGVPAEALLTASAGAEMIVVGSRGAGGFAKLRMGSVSSYVSHHAHCPVVVVPDDGI